jgi:ankyrin repeat protein
MYAATAYDASASKNVEMLIAAGANIKAVDNDGQTSLMLALQKDFVETIKVLLKAGPRPSINAKSKAGRTALMYAIEARGYFVVEKVKLIMAAGADVNIADNQGRTALMIARETRDERIVKLLAEVTKP